MEELGLVKVMPPEVCQLPASSLDMPVDSDVLGSFCARENCRHGLTAHSRGMTIHDRCLMAGCKCQMAVLTDRAKLRVKREVIA